MLTINVPGFKQLQLKHLVLDYNGTLACDGKLLPDVTAVLNKLTEVLTIHIITADTFSSVAEEVANINCQLKVISQHEQDRAKEDYVNHLNANHVVAIGNGRNDCLMLQQATLGIAVMQQEGAAAKTLQAADLASYDILAALNLLLKPNRLIATLRN